MALFERLIQLSPILGRSLLAGSVLTFAAVGVGCSAQAGAATPTTGATSALSGSGGDGGVPASLEPCLTTFVECVRAGTDDKTCHEDLHECLRPPPPPGAGGGHGDGDGDGPHDCDRDGGPMGPPPGDPGRPPPPPRDGDGGAPPGPPPGDHGHDGPPPPPPDADGGAPGGPRACVDALETCAKGTDAADACVSAAVACFEALPPPPHAPPHR
jgi:hypothetical protein